MKSYCLIRLEFAHSYLGCQKCFICIYLIYFIVHAQCSLNEYTLTIQTVYKLHGFLYTIVFLLLLALCCASTSICSLLFTSYSFVFFLVLIRSSLTSLLGPKLLHFHILIPMFIAFINAWCSVCTFAFCGLSFRFFCFHFYFLIRL